MIENIWEGVYSDFKEVPVSGTGFNGDKWATNSLKKISELLEAAKKQGTILSVVAYRASLLPLLAALVREEAGMVSILDFGGSLGFTYVPVALALVEKSCLDYHIVDVERICESGTRLFENDDRVHFHTLLPSIPEVDIVHMGSSLQYIRDWKELVNKLADYQPRYFMFTDLPAGDIPTYATAQCQ
jgi:putative methyltransferase (TIGR04325 family)